MKRLGDIAGELLDRVKGRSGDDGPDIDGRIRRADRPAQT